MVKPLSFHFQKLKSLGYKLIIIPSDLQRAAIKSIQETLKVIKANGDSGEMAAKLTTFNEREKIIEAENFLKFEFKE